MNPLSKPLIVALFCISYLGTARSGQEPQPPPGSHDSLAASQAETRGILDVLRKFTLSGYIQTQFRSTSENGAPAQFSGGDFPLRASSLFHIRRGRLKLTYDNVLTRAVIQIDATQNGISLRDAYVWALDPWTQSFGVQAGGFDRPFGFEIGFSSGSRESPERARATQTLFPGERDIGVKMFYAPKQGSLQFLRVDLGVFNGSGVNAPEYDDFKDIIGRVGARLPLGGQGVTVDAGVSGYAGHVRNDTRFLWTHGTTTSGERGFVLDSSASNTGAGVPRRYAGADIQVTTDVPGIGALTVRGEIFAGTQPGTSEAVLSSTGTLMPEGKNLRNTSPTNQASGPVYRRSVLGWYATVVQNLGSRVQAVLKYDVLDPNTDIAGGDFGPGRGLSPADVRFATAGIGGIFHWDRNIRFMLYYEMVRNEEVRAAAGLDPALEPFTRDRRDDVFTARLQVRF